MSAALANQTPKVVISQAVWAFKALICTLLISDHQHYHVQGSGICSWYGEDAVDSLSFLERVATLLGWMPESIDFGELWPTRLCSGPVGKYKIGDIRLE